MSTIRSSTRAGRSNRSKEKSFSPYAYDGPEGVLNNTISSTVTLPDIKTFEAEKNSLGTLIDFDDSPQYHVENSSCHSNLHHSETFHSPSSYISNANDTEEEKYNLKTTKFMPSDNSIDFKASVPGLKEMPDPKSSPYIFSLCPAPSKHTILCRITRDRRGFDKTVYPIYYLHMEQPSLRKNSVDNTEPVLLTNPKHCRRGAFILAARRRKHSRTSNYLISADPTDLTRYGDSYCGKLRSNVMGTQFVLYGSEKTLSVATERDLQEQREISRFDGKADSHREMAAIIYDKNFLGFKGPRRITVLIPDKKNDINETSPLSSYYNYSLLNSWHSGSTENVIEFRNKCPVWNGDSESYVLNFHGRVTQPSIKNFQLVENNNVDRIILQFGRVGSDSFTMDYSYPLCALQAFGIVLSSFDGKLACE